MRSARVQKNGGPEWAVNGKMRINKNIPLAGPYSNGVSPPFVRHLRNYTGE